MPEDLTSGWSHLVGQGGGADREIEAACRPPVEHPNALHATVLSVCRLVVDRRDLHAGRCEEALDLTDDESSRNMGWADPLGYACIFLHIAWVADVSQKLQYLRNR